MVAPLTSEKSQLNGRSIALAVTLTILMSIAPHEASARGGPLHLFTTRAEAAPIGSSRTEPTTETLSRCGGKRYETRLPIGVAAPADFGN